MCNVYKTLETHDVAANVLMRKPFLEKLLTRITHTDGSTSIQPCPPPTATASTWWFPCSDLTEGRLRS